MHVWIRLDTCGLKNRALVHILVLNTVGIRNLTIQNPVIFENNKIAAIIQDFKKLGFQISDPIQKLGN